MITRSIAGLFALVLCLSAIGFSPSAFAKEDKGVCTCSGTISFGESMSVADFDKLCTGLANKGCDPCGSGRASCTPKADQMAETDCTKASGDSKPFLKKLITEKEAQSKVVVSDYSCVYGGSDAKPGRYGLTDPLNGISIPQLIGGVIKFAVGLLGVLFLLMVVYAGMLWMTAGGDSKKITTAQKTLVYAFAGLLVVGLSYFLISFIFTFSAEVATPLPT